MDLLRFHKWTMGSLWVAEYGDPDVEEEFTALCKISPLHSTLGFPCIALNHHGTGQLGLYGDISHTQRRRSMVPFDAIVQFVHADVRSVSNYPAVLLTTAEVSFL